MFFSISLHTVQINAFSGKLPFPFPWPAVFFGPPQTDSTISSPVAFILAIGYFGHQIMSK